MKPFLPISQWLFCVFAGVSSLPGADAPPVLSDPSPTAAKLIPGSFRVLEQKIVPEGGRHLILNRITVPRFTKPVVPQAVALTPEQEASAAKRHESLSLSATVYDHEVSVLRWKSGGRQHVAHSNIDFSLVAGMGGFESGEAVYSLFLGWGLASRADLSGQPGAAVVPALADFPEGVSVYFLSSEEEFTAEDEPVLAALDALHEYFDTHRAEVMAAYQERQRVLAESLARQQWAKDHPAPPQDTVIHFWEKPTTAKQSAMGGQP
jgi:hypothetical protein